MVMSLGVLLLVLRLISGFQIKEAHISPNHATEGDDVILTCATDSRYY